VGPRVATGAMNAPHARRVKRGRGAHLVEWVIADAPDLFTSQLGFDPDAGAK